MARRDPLLDRFPELRSVPRVDLGVRESPVEEWRVGDARFWVKRDDLNAPRLGGNKVRALEFLLAGVEQGSTVATVGGIGSTHILTTAVHARALGAATIAWRWPHEQNDVSRAVAAAIAEHCDRAPIMRGPSEALTAARWYRLRHRVRWVPFGGTSPLGIIGHLKGGLELAEQIAGGALPVPSRVFVPWGTGGTAVGLALGFGAAGLDTTVVAVRCGPSVGAEIPWLRWLVARTRGLMRRLGVPAGGLPRPARVLLDHGSWAGAYGRPLPAATELVRNLGNCGRALDATYSAKACYAAWRAAGDAVRGPVLFWHTFDSRWMDGTGTQPMAR